MLEWSKLIEDLDARGENEVRIELDDIEGIVGDLPEGAWVGPARKGLSDYWRTAYVLPALEEGGWTVDFADYPKQVIGFRRLSPTGELTEAGSLAATIQHLLSQARRVGVVTSVSATKVLEDGTSITLSIDPSGQERSDETQDRQRTREVSPSHPIRRLRSTEASSDSIRYDDRSMVRWPVDGADKRDHEGLRRAVRRRVTGLEEGQGLGGYGCLATMSQKKSSQTKTPAVYSPAALGLRRVQEEDALFDLVVQQKVAVVSISGHGHDSSDSIRAEIKNMTPQSVRLFIPAGTVFEQEARDPEAQDLMLKDPISLVLSPDETQSIEAHGLCMDAGRDSPHGETLLLTPWILSTGATTQAELWSVTEDEE